MPLSIHLAYISTDFIQNSDDGGIITQKCRWSLFFEVRIHQKNLKSFDGIISTWPDWVSTFLQTAVKKVEGCHAHFYKIFMSIGQGFVVLLDK